MDYRGSLLGSSSAATRAMSESSAEKPVRAATRAMSESSAENSCSAEKPAGAEKSARSPERVPDINPARPQYMTLSTLCDIFADRGEEARVKQFLRDVATLRAWQSQAHPSHKVRDAMTKLGSKWVFLRKQQARNEHRKT